MSRFIRYYSVNWISFSCAYNQRKKYRKWNMNYLKVRNTHSWFYYLKNSSCGLICYRFLKYSRVHVVPFEVMPPINPFVPRGIIEIVLDLEKKTFVRIIFPSHFIVVYPYWIFYHAVIVFSFNMLTYR